jgi:hypothetical protein
MRKNPTNFYSYYEGNTCSQVGIINYLYFIFVKTASRIVSRKQSCKQKVILRYIFSRLCCSEIDMPDQNWLLFAILSGLILNGYSFVRCYNQFDPKPFPGRSPKWVTRTMVCNSLKRIVIGRSQSYDVLYQEYVSKAKKSIGNSHRPATGSTSRDWDQVCSRRRYSSRS